jgi:Xaa-Pro dipeptidase
MSAHRNDESEYGKRIKHFQDAMEKNGICAALIQKPRNLYYYAGTGQPSNLWIPAHGEPILFTRRAHELAKSATWIKQVHTSSNYTDMIVVLKELNHFPTAGKTIGIESDVIPFNMVEKFKKDFPDVKLMNISGLVMRQRFVKSEDEIMKIRNASQLWSKGHEAILETIQVGKTEYEIAAAIENAARKNGGDGTVWFHRWDACLPGGGIVASGPNAWVVSGHAMTVTGVGISPALPWGSSDRQLEKGDLVVVDYGICKESYHCDMARTYCVGKASNKQKDLWNNLIELHFKVIEQVRPGVTGAELYQHAVELAKKMKMEDYFMGVGNDRGTYIGHSIGLELDEWPVLGPAAHDPIEVNSIITLEPKFMVPGLGSVMVEDDILIKPNGYEIIGSVGHELFEIS